MENLPIYISIFFGLTTALTLLLFYKATNYSKPALSILLLWLFVQAGIAASGFYTVTDTLPPRFLVAVLPPLLVIITLFATSQGRRFIDGFNLPALTLLHVVRIPVELVLYWLFLHQVVPQLMTFEGRNLDILSGLSAPLIFYFGLVKKQLNKKIVLLWNGICLGLLVNIVLYAILSAPFPIQKFAFTQPNIAVLYFPFIWLPSCIVPLVLLSHLAAIWQLVVANKKTAPVISPETGLISG